MKFIVINGGSISSVAEFKYIDYQLFINIRSVHGREREHFISIY